MMAVEERIELGILVAGGLPPWKLDPAADPINFAPHVRVPVLTIAGKQDYMFPVETSARPMHDFLGSADADKELKIYDVGHGGLSGQIRGDVLGWLDRYFGPVD